MARPPSPALIPLVIILLFAPLALRPLALVGVSSRPPRAFSSLLARCAQEAHRKLSEFPAWAAVELRVRSVGSVGTSSAPLVASLR
eukprot:9491722-Pyramimonas_sp.AAC.1